MDKITPGRPESAEISVFFRSHSQMMILAKVILGESPSTLTELANFAGVTKSAVTREVIRLKRFNIVSTQKQGSNILVSAAVTGAILGALQTLLMRSVGPLQVIPDEFAGIDGIEELYIFGSWAARFEKESGHVPHDIDLLVVGTASYSILSDAADRAMKKLNLGIEVDLKLISAEIWNDPNNTFYADIRSKPLIQLIPAVTL